MVVLLIGLSLLAVTVVRANSVPRLMSFSNEETGATSGWVLYPSFLMFDRDFSVSVRAGNVVNVYILDEAGIEQWHDDQSVDAVLVYENISDGIFSEPHKGRGGYAVLVYLPEDDVTYIKVAFTFSGFEKDMWLCSLTTTIAGILLLSVILLSTKIKKQKVFSYKR
ncbi:MAG: hypothetical protein LBE70_00785 [Nitrososphaerota archaeon]|nr:hypothetical protein [Nitrososphaerota archaeon]